METKFQTSFIPKKPLSTVGVQGVNTGVPMHLRPSKTGSWLFNSAVFLFIVSLGIAAVLYSWKIVLLNNQNSYKQQLADLQKQFNTTLIQQLEVANMKIDDAKKILSTHIALSNIFDVIAKTTAANTRLLSMDVTTPLSTGTGSSASQNSSDINLTFSGSGTNLSAVAFQEQVLSELDKYGQNGIVKNPIISSPTVETDGSVSFSLVETIDPSNVIYMKGNSGATTNNK